MASLVLALGMRRPTGQRAPWLLLGSGLVVLAVTDSTYVSLVYAGQTGLTGTPLIMGWMSAWFLVPLAPWAPRSPATAESSRNIELATELVPYIPVFFAVLASGGLVLSTDPFLVAIGGVLLFLVAARQVMIVYENVVLTRDLEAKVALRTTELTGLSSIVQSSVDAIVGKTPEGVITSWNPGAERLCGWSAAEVVGRNVDVLIPKDRREEEATVLESARNGEQVQRWRPSGFARTGPGCQWR